MNIRLNLRIHQCYIIVYFAVLLRNMDNIEKCGMKDQHKTVVLSTVESTKQLGEKKAKVEIILSEISLEYTML